MKQKFLSPPSLKDLAKQKFFEVALPKLASNEQQLNKSISSICTTDVIREYCFDLYESHIMAQCSVVKMPSPFKAENLDPEIKLAYISCGDQIIFFNRKKKASFSLSSDPRECKRFDSALGLNTGDVVPGEQYGLSIQDVEMIKKITPFTPEMRSCVGDFYGLDKFINYLVTTSVQDFNQFIELFRNLSQSEIKKIDETKLFCLLGTKAAFDCVSKTEKLDEKTPDQQLAILHYLLLSPNCNRELLIHACNKMNCGKKLKAILPEVDDAQFRKFIESLKRIPFEQREKLGEVELLCLLGTRRAFDAARAGINLRCLSSYEKVRMLQYILLSNDRTLLTYAPKKMELMLDKSFGNLISFKRADFFGWNLSGLDLSRIDFSGSDFSDTNLLGAKFFNSNIHNAKFKKAILSDAKFPMDFRSVKEIRSATWEKAELAYADLRGMDLAGIWFWKTDCTGAKLDGSDFTNSDLRGAKLSKANLIGTKFRRADLSKVDLLERLFILKKNSYKESIRDKKIVDFIPESLIKEYLIDLFIRKGRIQESKFINSYGYKFVEFLATTSIQDFFQCIKVLSSKNLYDMYSSDLKIYKFLLEINKALAKKFVSQCLCLSVFHDFLSNKADNRGLLFDICREMKCFRVLRTQVMFWLSDEEFQKFKRSLKRIPLVERERLGEVELLCLLGTVKSFNTAFTKFNLKSRSIEDRKRMLQYIFLSNDPSLLKHAAKELGLKRDGIFGGSFIDLSSTHFKKWDLSNLRFDKIDVSFANFKEATLLGAQFTDAYVECANFTKTITSVDRVNFPETKTSKTESPDAGSSSNFQGVKGIGFWHSKNEVRINGSFSHLEINKARLNHLSFFSGNDKLTLIRLFEDYISGPMGIGFLTRNYVAVVKQVLQQAGKNTVEQLIELLAQKLAAKNAIKPINSQGALYHRMDEFCLLKLGKSFSDYLQQETSIIVQEAISGRHGISD